MKKCIKEITWKFTDASDKYPELKNMDVKITSPKDLYDAFRFLFDGEVQEKFVVFWWSSANEVVGLEVITPGLLNSSLVHPREVFQGAIIASCYSIILVHNHLSGNLESSIEDLAAAKKKVEAGKNYSRQRMK